MTRFREHRSRYRTQLLGTAAGICVWWRVWLLPTRAQVNAEVRLALTTALPRQDLALCPSSYGEAEMRSPECAFWLRHGPWKRFPALSAQAQSRKSKTTIDMQVASLAEAFAQVPEHAMFCACTHELTLRLLSTNPELHTSRNAHSIDV